MLGKNNLIILGFVFLLSFNLVSALEGFESNNLLLKLSLKEGDESIKSINLMSDKTEKVSLEVLEIPGVVLEESSIELKAGTSNDVKVYFQSEGIRPGVYVGNIKLSDSEKVHFIPVIFEVESKSLFFDVNLDIPPHYSEISSGEKIVAQVKVFDLVAGGGIQQGLGAVSVDIEYLLFDSKGNLMSSESDSIIVNKQAQVTKSVTFPEKTASGDYVFAAIVKYGESVGSSSQIFSVKSPSQGLDGFSFGNSSLLAFMGLVALFFIGLILLFIYLIHDRDKLILDLQKYNKNEFARQRDLILAQSKLVKSKKGVNKKEVDKEVRAKIREIKNNQNERVRELKVLRNKGDSKGMEQKIKEWKIKGYNVSPLEYKLKGLSADEMKKIMEKWKKQGYKIK